MRMLSTADSPGDAQKIVDGLLVDGIEAQVRPEGGTEVWVIDHDQLPAARTSMAQRATEDARALGKQANELRRASTKAADDHAERFVDIGTRWRGISAGGAGPLTIFLIAGSLVIALLGATADEGADPMWTLTIDHFSSTEPLARIQAGQWWRLLTPMFLHFGLLHLGFNMMWVWSLGPQVEANHGSLVMAALVVVSEVAGNLGQYWASGPGFGGMSGVVYALFGFVWMSARYDRRHRYAISERNTWLVMGWFVLCATGAVGPIANIGHAGGLVIGLLFGLPAYLRHLRARRSGPKPQEGSWADVHRTGFAAFRHRVLLPYAPLWFLVIAGGVIGVEYGTKRARSLETRLPSCEAYLRELHACDPSEASAAAMEGFEAWVEQYSGDPEVLRQLCRELQQFPACGDSAQP